MRLTPTQAIDAALAFAATHPDVIDLVAVASTDSTVSLRWANNTLTTNGAGWSDHLSVVAYVARNGGVATATLSENDPDYDLAFVQRLVEAAVSQARHSEPSKKNIPLVRDLHWGDWDSAANTTDLDVVGRITPQLGEVLSRGAREGRNHSGYAEHSRTSTWTGSLGGIRLRESGEDGRVEMTSRCDDGTRSAWEGRHSRTFTDIDVLQMNLSLERQLGWQLKRRDLAPGRYRTILGSGPVGDMLATFDSNLTGRDAVEGSGPFALPDGRTRIGQRIAGDRSYNLYSDPTLAGIDEMPYVVDLYDGPVSSVFDTGLPTTRVDWVREGVLNALCTSRAVAQETGLEHHANVGNLVLDVDGGQGDLEDLVARTEHGVLVNCLWYIRDLDDATMTVTGTTRDGVYEVRDGEVVGAVNNFRFNESPLAMLSRIVDAGTPVLCQTRENAEYVSDFVMPPLVVDGFNMSSVSEAN